MWNVYPDGKTVDVVRLDEGGHLLSVTYTEEATLTGGDVLPGFEVAVERLFS